MDMKDLCTAAMSEEQRHIRTVLATVVHVEGHAYRKEGVSMILTEDGRHYGTISPGCLEEDLCARVEQAWNHEGVCMVEYDMRPKDDLSWGENIGCGGLLHILLEPVRGILRDTLLSMNDHLGRGEVVMLTRSFDRNGAEVNYQLLSEGHSINNGEPNRSEHESEAVGSSLPLSPTPLVLAHGYSTPDPDPKSKGQSAQSDPSTGNYVFVRTYRPKPRLVLIGAGDDSRMVSMLAQSSGFDVVIGDWRETLCTPVRFPGAQCVIGFPQRLLEQIKPGQGDYLLLMSHNFPREREWIELLEGCPYAYLGIMGSSERTRRLFEGLPNYPHVHSPVGLSIGADGPDEIAISIAAELIAVKRGKQSRSKEVTVHEHRRTRAGSR
ncbi:XdhC family protein [Paenibacillus sp. WLX2291]|uniref:XdhC family protein n=1 Tax=Paenibacillus sp. WLX2291 TaxID=3296934 RepID=UPI003984074C